MKGTVRFLIGAMVLSLMYGVCLVGAEETKGVKEITATIDQDGVQKVTVLGGGYFFDPDYIIVKVNVPVALTVSKEEGFVPHNIVMSSPEAGMEFDEELSTTPAIITFTPTKVGKYPIYCSKKLLFLESHKDKGMHGTLDVRE